MKCANARSPTFSRSNTIDWLQTLVVAETVEDEVQRFRGQMVALR